MSLQTQVGSVKHLQIIYATFDIIVYVLLISCKQVDKTPHYLSYFSLHFNHCMPKCMSHIDDSYTYTLKMEQKIWFPVKLLMIIVEWKLKKKKQDEESIKPEFSSQIWKGHG